MRNRDIETAALVAVIVLGVLILFGVACSPAAQLHRLPGWGSVVRPDDTTRREFQIERDRLRGE